MNPGSMNHRLELQRASVARTLSGSVTRTWGTFATVWGSVKPISGREFWAAQQAQSSVTHQVEVRFCSGLAPTDRVLWGSRILNIESVINVDERGATHRIMCVEDVITDTTGEGTGTSA